MKWVIVQDAISTKAKIPGVRSRYPLRTWTAEEGCEAIFNKVDDKPETVVQKRLMRAASREDLAVLDPFFQKLEEVKDPTHVVTGLGYIRSLKGCPKQDPHTDYYSLRSHGKTKDIVMPYSGVVALEDGSSIYMDGQKVKLPRRSAVLFRGDVVHNGSEYKTDNIRVHFYMDVVKAHEASSGTHIHWVRRKKKKN
eukprot:CAMPEP_0114461428 /NCGR_PEP_ID=MMETSP0104-20121206/6270_1 /TAXON_ID=37642 ORGANISM="Paraphysomonas imperforata, Strain PA2" /NCGR_SAMPLE_ID=MMETSP0104 /ASSEMBLY_ACC=CAM_ASM_000202 /LENGTH=194 /DNA_ID=CAMNT_0001634199 /DNA_START=163 /DNA_END=747 /DNA_ORIENTATION=-